MKEQNQNVFQLHNKKIYVKRSFKGWSIVIMPENILLDNFHHGYAHIHPDRKELKTKDLETTLIKILEHISNNEGVDYDKLRKELIKWLLV